MSNAKLSTVNFDVNAACNEALRSNRREKLLTNIPTNVIILVGVEWCKCGFEFIYDNDLMFMLNYMYHDILINKGKKRKIDDSIFVNLARDYFETSSRTPKGALIASIANLYFGWYQNYSNKLQTHTIANIAFYVNQIVLATYERTKEINAYLDKILLQAQIPNISFNPDWCSNTVINLVKNIVNNQDFSSTPILADALQDVGFTHEETIRHLQQDECFLSDWIIWNILGM